MLRPRRNRESQAPIEASTQLVSITASSFRVNLRADRRRESQLLRLYSVQPPFIKPGLHFRLEEMPQVKTDAGATGEKDDPEPKLWDLCVLDIDLGNEALEGRGIGSLMIASALQEGLALHPDLTTISRGRGTLAFAKSLGKVVGLHNLNLVVDDTQYGPDSEDNLPAEAAWDNYPSGKEFLAHSVQGIIEPERIERINVARQAERLGETGRAGLWR